MVLVWMILGPYLPLHITRVILAIYDNEALIGFTCAEGKLRRICRFNLERTHDSEKII